MSATFMTEYIIVYSKYHKSLWCETGETRFRMVHVALTPQNTPLDGTNYVTSGVAHRQQEWRASPRDVAFGHHEDA